MAKTSYFAMSPEERALKNQRKLEVRLRNLKECAEAILAIEDTDSDEEAEVLVKMVENALDAYMRLGVVNRPEGEHYLMSRLAFDQMRIKRELREEAAKS